MNIDIIGGGIGGLVSAISLKQKEIDFRIFESAKLLNTIGAGIFLASNAMQVFKKMDIYEQIVTNGNEIKHLNITSNKLKILSNTDFSFFEKKYGVKSIAIHRGTLQNELLKFIDKKTVFYGKKVISSNLQNENDILLEFEDKTNIKSKYVIGADGIHSAVRDTYFQKGKFRSYHQACWRGVVEYNLPKKYENELNEAWWNGKRFGFVHITKNKVYWYALKSFKKNIKELSECNLEEYFQDFHPIIRELLKNTPTIYSDEIKDLIPLKKWFKGNVVLLGDAAHAMTPNLGQGACQAIEDAYVLSECLSKYLPKKAIEQYQKLRCDRVNSLVRTSRYVGRVAHIENEVLSKCIHFIMKNIPNSFNRSHSDKIYSLPQV